MSKATHTPGPWKLIGPSGDGKAISVAAHCPDGRRLRCFVDSDDCDYDAAMADAVLIAAAPDLLAACHGGRGAQEDAFAANLMTFADVLDGKADPDLADSLKPREIAAVLRLYAAELRAAIARATPAEGG